MRSATSSTFMKIAFSLVCVLHTIFAAFTVPICDYSHSMCVQNSTGGTWCFATTSVVTSTTCPSPYSLALATHLKQDLSIAYYSPTGRRLGGVNYPVPPSSIIYLCMSAQVGPDQYHTRCAQAEADNGWESTSCVVSLAPSPVSDGCYDDKVKDKVGIF